MASSNKLSIVIADDHPVFRHGLRDIIESEPASKVVGNAGNGEEALEKLQDFDADIILLDLLMPIKSGVEFLQSYDIASKHPGVKILVFTNMDNAPEINEALRLGADKCIIKAWTSPQGLIKLVDNMLSQDTTARAH